MAIIRATAVLVPAVGSLAKDEIRNVWHFQTGGAPTTPGLTAIGEGVGAFYHALGAQLANFLPRGSAAHRVELAAVTQGNAGAADDDVTELLATVPFQIGIAAGGAVDLPRETAMVFSFQGDQTGQQEEAGLIRPKSRRRGRLYLGPLNSSVLLNVGANGGMFTTAARDAVITAYTAQLQAAITAPPLPANRAQHIVYSRASALTHPVLELWVNNEPDVVRSRQVGDTARTTQATSQPSIV